MIPGLAAAIIGAAGLPPEPRPDPLLTFVGNRIAGHICIATAHQFGLCIDDTYDTFFAVFGDTEPDRWGAALVTPAIWQDVAAVIFNHLCGAEPEAPLAVTIH